MYPSRQSFDVRPDEESFAATTLVRRVKEGSLSPVALAEACLERIDDSEWLRIDREAVVAQAQHMDDLRKQGKPTGRLHGVPVGVAGAFDASAVGSAVVERLCEVGAVVVGFAPGRTLAHAIADLALPLAIGDLSPGETMRDASHHGIYGFKPTRGVISRRGANAMSETLSQVGVLARSLRDVALLADALSGYDSQDRASYLRPRPTMERGALADAPVEPSIAYLQLQIDNDHSDSTRQGLEELAELIGVYVDLLEAPKTFQPLLDAEHVLQVCERDGSCYGDEYTRALNVVESGETFFANFFHDYDAILAPSAYGEKSIPTSDVPALSRIASACGLPSVSLPLLEGESGLPVNIQLIGGAEEDARLLRCASWLIRKVSNTPE